MTAPTMLARAQEYLAFRRTLGFTLGTLGQEVLLFARWADRTGHAGPLTTELIVRWAQQTPRRSPAYWAWRFHAVRLFAQHRALSDPQTEVPPAGLLGQGGLQMGWHGQDHRALRVGHAVIVHGARSAVTRLGRTTQLSSGGAG